jgi:superfamily I DNA/RNA helicase
MTTAQTQHERRGAPRPAHVHAELSAAQRAAVGADARLVVVQGGPGTGKTEAALARIARLTASQRLDPAWLLALVTSEAKVQPFRLRLARALAAAGRPESAIRRKRAKSRVRG